MTDILHRGGVRWNEAPLPRRWHRCKPQGCMWRAFGSEYYLERCACGARRIVFFSSNDIWTDKNERRTGKSETFPLSGRFVR